MANYRPMPFYFITTRDPEELGDAAAGAAAKRLADLGFGGAVLFNKPPGGFTPETYLGPPWFAMVRAFAEAFQAYGLDLWINDGFDFPPGNVAGRVAAIAPELCQRRLRRDAAGAIHVEEVPWGFPAFEEPESSRLFIELVYEAYRREVGDFFGHPIVGFFSDADCRRVGPDARRPESPHRDYFPWSRTFAADFGAAFGYAIEPHLPDLLDRRPCPASRDYWDFAGRLYAQWFANNHAWCTAHDLRYTFHTSDTGPLPLAACARSSVYSEGSYANLTRHADYPGTDHELLCLDGGTHFHADYHCPRVSWGAPPTDRRSPTFTSVRGDIRAKAAASVAFLHGKRGAMCELFAATNWGVTPAELRHIAAWQIMQGITFLVPHAVHHRSHPVTRDFAPPDVSLVPTACRALNDELAGWVEQFSRGEFIAPVAVLDPTPWVWTGETDAAAFFDVCAELNRRPHGYVIASLDDVRANPGQFQVVVNPGLPVSAPDLPLLDAADLDALPPCPIAWDGPGTPHYHRRRLADGELVAIANIEADELIAGDLVIRDNRHPLLLHPGDIAFVTTPAGNRQSRRSESASHTWRGDASERPDERLPLPSVLPVTWAGPNLLPLPDTDYDLDDQARGGDFDVGLEVTNPWHRLEAEQYNLRRYLPETVAIRLSPRRRELRTDTSWALQGQPFYSGTVTYHLPLELPTAWRAPHLVLPEVACVCEITLDGRPQGVRAWPPYIFPLDAPGGELRLTVTNTLANRFETYAAPSGILAGGWFVNREDGP